MRTYVYLIACIATTSLLASCQVEPGVNPTDAYVGSYDCTLTSKTVKLTGTSELVETKSYAGKVTKTAEASLELKLTTAQDSGELTIPMAVAGESFVIPQFVTASSYTAAGTTTYLSNYYTGNGRLGNSTLSFSLNSANYRTIGANGNQAQISTSDVDCNCVKKQYAQ